jgi:hypothetical protein
MPSLLLPWKNPAWFQFISHKVLRLVTPWLLLAAWGLSFALAGHSLYTVLFIGQTLLLIVGIVAWLSPPIRRIPPLGIIATVFALNYAAWYAFWIWLAGGTIRSWKKVPYGGAKVPTQLYEGSSMEPANVMVDKDTNCDRVKLTLNR